MSVPRTEKLRNKATLSPGEALLVSRDSDIRWLTGFSGSNGAVLITDSEIHIFTDGRYGEQVVAQTQGCSIHVESGSALGSATAFVASMGLREIQFQGDHLSFELVQKLCKDLPKLICRESTVSFDKLRSVKDPAEVEAIRQALRITERTFTECLTLIEEGISELDLAAEIDYRQRKLGAEKSSFETIVAFGSRTALPHARPGQRRLKRGEPILVDFGCVFGGYASDMTRMIHFGEPTPDFLSAFQSVERALHAASKQARAGITGKELDETAREIFRESNVEPFFCHSLGHGVGLDIHEWPSVSSRNEDLLPTGCIITIEPGVYFEGRFGIRIENMVCLNEQGCTTFNDLDTKLVVL
ncbi:MAG: aminopeptidase P family protein [Bacteroidetes bacterium]|nr:aminopeptidase P family protein [Bacteroidota bacterium]